MPRTPSPEASRDAAVHTVRGSAFGLSIDSTYALPGLGPADPGTSGRPLRLELVAGAVIDSLWQAESSVEIRRVHHPDGSVALVTQRQANAGWLMSAPGFGRHLVTDDGLQVRSAPAVADPELWQSVLVGQVLPAAAALAGLETLHASAVASNGGAVALTGPAGAGKSTVAAHLAMLGGAFLTDDVLALEKRGEELLAHPGLGVAGIRRQAVPALRARGAEPIIDGRAKAQLPFGPHGRARPLRALYFLEAGGSKAPRIEPLTPGPRRLLATAFSVGIRTPGRLARQLDICATLAHDVPCFRAQAPPGGHAQLAELILEHAAPAARL